jgi:hypothetical protein
LRLPIGFRVGENLLAIWQTITGLTQWQRFISAAVNPWSQRLRPTTGRLKNGHFSIRILFNSEKRALRSFSLKSVPNLPGN